MCNLGRIFFERMFEDSFNSLMKMDANYFKLYYYNFTSCNAYTKKNEKTRIDVCV